jgi:hypothetical protein
MGCGKIHFIRVLLMAIVDLPVFGGSYATKSKIFSSQQLTNFYYVPAQGAALSDGYIIGTDGITQVANIGNYRNASRGALVMSGVAYYVQGDRLVRLNSDMTLTDIGEIAGEDRVSMATNGTQLMILNELGDGYIFEAGTLSDITDSGFTANGTPQITVYYDGYFICSTDEKKFIKSDIDDGLAWNALDFSRADGDPDEIVAPLSFRGQLYMLGAVTSEAFQNVGGTDFPIAKIKGLIINKGLSFRHAVVSASDSFFWIGAGENESPAVWGSTGQTAEKISTDAEDFIIRGELQKEGIQNTFGFYYAQDGSYFVGFSLPTKTIVYELVSKRWHTRESLIDDVSERWRVNSLCQVYGGIYVGDSQDGRIGKLSPDTYKEYGNAIISTWITQPFSNQGEYFSVSSFEATCESGVGTSEEPNPQIRLSWSKDGRNFSDERPRALGKVGEYLRRAIWRRLGGFSRLAIMKLVISDNCKKMIIKIQADIQ